MKLKIETPTLVIWSVAMALVTLLLALTMFGILPNYFERTFPLIGTLTILVAGTLFTEVFVGKQVKRLKTENVISILIAITGFVIGALFFVKNSFPLFGKIILGIYFLALGVFVVKELYT